MEDTQEREVKIIDVKEEEPIDFKYAITSYGADYPVDGLVSRLNENKILIPKFQRQYVWKHNQASRFIESLLLGLPVPGVFLSKDPESSKLLVIDGQQRLKTIQYFVNGVFVNDRKFKLKGVQPEFEGLSYDDLPEDLKTEFNDYVIHATIIRQDEPSNDQSSIYHIFERLNTGGTPLQAQEIRACIFFGELNDLLFELNENESFRKIYGKKSNRLKDQELILRFISLFFRADEYEKPLKGFMNEYMGYNRHLQHNSKEEIIRAFVPTIEVLFEALGTKAFRVERGINAALYDSSMVGVANRLKEGPIDDIENLREVYSNFMSDERILNFLKSGTSDVSNVEGRLKIAIDYFSKLK